jgi:hypothetical protein
MKLVIETFQRSEQHYIAIACPDGSLWSEAAVGGGVTERSAIQESINAYFKRNEPVEPLVSAPTIKLPDEPIVPLYRRGSLRAVRGEGEDGARAVLTAYFDDTRLVKPPVKIAYTDAEGSDTEREIRPLKLDEAPGRFGFLQPRLIARNVSDGEVRHFRLDRVRRMEWAAGAPGVGLKP